MPEIKVTIDQTCDWFEDQRFSEETKNWLRNRAESSVPTDVRAALEAMDEEELEWLLSKLLLPSFVQDDLRRVSQNTNLGVRNCPHIN